MSNGWDKWRWKVQKVWNIVKSLVLKWEFIGVHFQKNCMNRQLNGCILEKCL
jgi:hypothetical protein